MSMPSNVLEVYQKVAEELEFQKIPRAELSPEQDRLRIGHLGLVSVKISGGRYYVEMGEYDRLTKDIVALRWDRINTSYNQLAVAVVIALRFFR